VRKPGAALAAIDAERLEAGLEVGGHHRSRPALVVEDEHRRSARLAIPAHGEPHPSSRAGGGAKLGDDRRNLSARPMPEERKREVQVLARDEPAAAELVRLPLRQLASDVVGEAECAEEPDPFIPLDATAHFRT
jgi:hypothetical protein